MCQTAAAVGIRAQCRLDPLVELLDDRVPRRIVSIGVEPAEERHLGDGADEAHVLLGEGLGVPAVAELRVGHRVVCRVEALVDHLERVGERSAERRQPLLRWSGSRSGRTSSPAHRRAGRRRRPSPAARHRSAASMLRLPTGRRAVTLPPRGPARRRRRARGHARSGNRSQSSADCWRRRSRAGPVTRFG